MTEREETVAEKRMAEVRRSLFKIRRNAIKRESMKTDSKVRVEIDLSFKSQLTKSAMNSADFEFIN